MKLRKCTVFSLSFSIICAFLSILLLFSNNNALYIFIFSSLFFAIFGLIGFLKDIMSELEIVIRPLSTKKLSPSPPSQQSSHPSSPLPCPQPSRPSFPPSPQPSGPSSPYSSPHNHHVQVLHHPGEFEKN